MQEYHSQHHTSPLIVLKNMRLSYFKDDTSTGFYVVTSLQRQWRFDRLDLILDMVKEAQGHFHFYKRNVGNNRTQMTLRTTDSNGNTLHHLTAWDFRWKDLMRALIRIQRFVIGRKLQMIGSTTHQQAHSTERRRDIFKIKPLIQFKKLQLLPADIMDYVIDLYFNGKSLHN